MPRQLRAPGAREKKQLLRELESEGEVACSVVGDISKTHMGCQIDEKETIPGDPDSQLVYVNKVGTFGLSPASYWWTSLWDKGYPSPVGRRLSPGATPVRR